MEVRIAGKDGVGSKLWVSEGELGGKTLLKINAADQFRTIKSLSALRNHPTLPDIEFCADG